MSVRGTIDSDLLRHVVRIVMTVALLNDLAAPQIDFKLHLSKSHLTPGRQTKRANRLAEAGIQESRVNKLHHLNYSELQRALRYRPISSLHNISSKV